MKAGMTFAAARAAAAKSGGMFVSLSAWSAPTSEKVREKRAEVAASKQAEHRAIGRVKVEAVAEGGVVLYRVAGQVNRDEHPEGVYLNKKGEPCVGIVIGAPTEYGYTTACPYAGKEGSACEMRRPFHAHRTINLTRLVAWVIAGEEQPRD